MDIAAYGGRIKPAAEAHLRSKDWYYFFAGS
jgi:hypothetical protein